MRTEGLNCEDMSVRRNKARSWTIARERGKVRHSIIDRDTSRKGEACRYVLIRTTEDVEGDNAPLFTLTPFTDLL